MYVVGCFDAGDNVNGGNLTMKKIWQNLESGLVGQCVEISRKPKSLQISGTAADVP